MVEGSVSEVKSSNNQMLFFGIFAIVTLLAGIFIGATFLQKSPDTGLVTGTSGQAIGTANSPSKEDVAAKTIQYINENFLKAQNAEAKLTDINEYSPDLYQVNFDIYQAGAKSNSGSVYSTKDGETVVLGSVLKLNEPLPVPEQPATTNNEPTAKTKCEDITKTAVPKLEAFVVSNCPFGLQMQRILVPVAKLLGGDKADIEVKYIGNIAGGKIQSMHGDAEAQENLKQICIREEQKDKYWDYIACYINAGDSAGCSKEAKIDETKLSSCISDPTKGLAYAQKDFDAANAYQVSGSPTLLLNGEKASEFGFGGRTPEAVKTLTCCGAATKPTECNTALSTTEAVTSFSSTSTGSTSGSCGT